MSDKTSIEWTDATWNPVTGCTPVSAGCDHCYAKTFAERWRGVDGHYFTNGFDLTLRPDKLLMPFQWTAPRRIFVNSMSDLFHADVPDGYIGEVFAVMAGTERHTYQVLTKRHARMRALLASRALRDDVLTWLRHWGEEEDVRFHDTADAIEHGEGWPLRNVWLGVSVESQHWADIRVPALLHTPAAVRFLSCEPLLGPVDLKRAVIPMGSQPGHRLTASFVHGGNCCDRFHGIDWVIAGGESGPGARPMHPAWVRDLRDQCTQARVPFLFKQWGMWCPAGVAGRSGHPAAYREMEPDHVPMVRVGKRAAGRLLDGRTWDEFPRGAVSS